MLRFYAHVVTHELDVTPQGETSRMDPSPEDITLPEFVDQPEEPVSRQFDQKTDERQEAGPFHSDGKEALQVLHLTFLALFEVEDAFIPHDVAHIVQGACHPSLIPSELPQLRPWVRLEEEGVSVGWSAFDVQLYGLEIVLQVAGG